MKNRVLFLLIGLFFAAGAGQAGQDYDQQGISAQIRQDSVVYQGRKLVADKEFAQIPPQAAQRMYEHDSQLIANQLQVISENEDNNKVVPGDTLTVTFKDRERTDRAAYKVSDAGEIFLPLLGSVRVSGLVRRQVRERLDMMLREYIRAPQTMVTVNTDGRMMIFGAVMLPGIYEVKNKITVMEGLLSAGGFDRKTAELASVIIIRGTAEKPEILKLNLKKMVQKGDRSEDIQVKPGDFIYVPTSMISNLEKFWSTAYTYIMQWYGLGGLPPVDGRDFNW